MAAPSPLLKKKWEHVFTTFFDINKNKAIDWNDFELLFEKIKQCRGEESTEFKIASDAMLAVWKGLLNATKGIDLAVEADDDVIVTMEEWDKLWSTYNPDRLPIWQQEYLKYMFFLLDSSGDKYLDKKEYAEVMGMYGLAKAEAEKAFDQISLVDGKRTDKMEFQLDYGAYVKLWNQFFTSEDPKAAGNALFGPLTK